MDIALPNRERFDATRWLDRNLIHLCSKFGDYQKDDPTSFTLNPCFSLFPQFMFNLQRSQFVQVCNNSPDETTYFRMLLNRENATNAAVMIQPSLISYSFNSFPTPALLDVASISVDCILLLDSYFNVVFHGMKIALWRSMGYQNQAEHQAFAELLRNPHDDAQMIIRERFPVPRLVICDQHGSQNDQSRTQVSISSRWGVIMKCCNKFRRCLAQVKNLHPSGASQVDIMLQAKQLYHQDENKHFVFEHCWPILQNNIRWHDVTPTNTVKSRIHTPFSPNSASDSPMDNCIFLEDDTSPSVGNSPSVGEGSVSAKAKRPMGRKTAKELLRKNQVVQSEVQKMSIQLDTFNQYLAEKEKKKDEREEKRMKALQEMKELEMKKHDFEIRRQEHEMKKEKLKIMTTDISYLDP
ncbi:unnamed protein product [Camellia sinensis]